MPYLQVDDQIAAHPKILAAGAEAAWLWLCAIAYCQRQLTDGYVPDVALVTLGQYRTPVKKLAGVLESVGLFDRVEDGYRVHDYLKHNPDKATVLERRALAAERKAKQRGHADVTVGHPRDTRDQGSARHGSVPLSSRGRVPTPTPTPTPTEGADAPSAPAATGVPDDPYLSDPGEMPTRRRKAHIAWESRRGLDVPHELHDELLRRMADPDDGVLRRWYGETEREWQGRAVGDTCWQFWRARFREWQGTTVTPITTRKADTAGWADGLVAGGGR